MDSLDVLPYQKIIAISGHSQAGKDFLFNNLKKYAFSRHSTFEFLRFSFGDILREELRSFISKNFDIDLFNMTPEEKELVRPFLIYYAEVRRQKTKGKYFVDLLDKKLRESWQQMDLFETRNVIPVITDLRFIQFEDDEYHWVKKNNGLVVYLDKILKYENGKPVYLQPPNEKEAENNPKLKEKADYYIVWEHGNTGDVKSATYNLLNLIEGK